MKVHKLWLNNHQWVLRSFFYILASTRMCSSRKYVFIPFYTYENVLGFMIYEGNTMCLVISSSYFPFTLSFVSIELFKFIEHFEPIPHQSSWALNVFSMGYNIFPCIHYLFPVNPDGVFSNPIISAGNIIKSPWLSTHPVQITERASYWTCL